MILYIALFLVSIKQRLRANDHGFYCLVMEMPQVALFFNDLKVIEEISFFATYFSKGKL